MTTAAPVTLRLSTILGVTFLVLKLCGVIAWAWWLVLLPFYAGGALLVLVLVAIGIGAVVVRGVASFRARRPAK